MQGQESSLSSNSTPLYDLLASDLYLHSSILPSARHHREELDVTKNSPARLIFATSLLLLAAGRSAAQEPSAAQTALDQRLFDMLRLVGNQGADLYNSGDRNGSYRFFQGALLAVRPLLDHHPDAQKHIDEGMQEAEKQGDLGKRAFELRKTLVEVRLKIKPNVDNVAVPKKLPAKPSGKLWERLGGVEGVTKIVDEFVEQARKDSRVNWDRDGKNKTDAQGLVTLKTYLVGYMSLITSGPLKYQGKDFREVTRGMKITNGELNAAIDVLKNVLVANNVSRADVEEITKVVDTARNEIVEEDKGFDRIDG